VEAFLESKYAVFSISPKQLDRFRDRYSAAGAKDDSRDAYVAADSLRTDQHCFRRIALDHPDVMRLRELSRTEENLGCDLRRIVNQLYQLLLRYYPQLLQLCSTPDESWLWALLELAPTPQQGARLTVARLKRLLSNHRIRRWTAEQVREVLGTPPLQLAAGSAEAISEHVLLLLPQLRLLHGQRQAVGDRPENCWIKWPLGVNNTPRHPNTAMWHCFRSPEWGVSSVGASSVKRLTPWYNAIIMLSGRIAGLRR
jgi:hypothetical protein